jgi:hypothetical protein
MLALIGITTARGLITPPACLPNPSLPSCHRPQALQRCHLPYSSISLGVVLHPSIVGLALLVRRVDDPPDSCRIHINFLASFSRVAYWTRQSVIGEVCIHLASAEEAAPSFAALEAADSAMPSSPVLSYPLVQTFHPNLVTCS